MSNLTPITSQDFEEKVINAVKPVLVDFGAPWCGPCKMLDPVIAELAGEYGAQVDFYTVNVDQSSDLAMRYGVMGVPTVIMFEGGEVIKRMTGFKPKKALVSLFFDED
jgi:thioredoxin 1